MSVDIFDIIDIIDIIDIFENFKNRHSDKISHYLNNWRLINKFLLARASIRYFWNIKNPKVRAIFLFGIVNMNNYLKKTAKRMIH